MRHLPQGSVLFSISFLDFYDEIDLSLQFKGIPAPLEMLLYRQSQWWLSPAGTILARSRLNLISFLQQCDCEIIIIITIACHDHYHHHHYHQVMVDWSKIVKNAQCVDKFVVWMWWVSFSRFYIHISSWWTTHDYLFEIQKQSRPDGTERIGKSAVSKEVAHSILPSFEYCNEENWKESTHWKPIIMPGRYQIALTTFSLDKKNNLFVIRPNNAHLANLPWFCRNNKMRLSITF